MVVEHMKTAKPPTGFPAAMRIPGISDVYFKD